MGARYDRYEPRRRDTKDSWITIDWGKKQPPSSLHGVLDQIAGHLLRDHRLIEQGKRELRKAAEYKKQRARGGKSSHGSSSANRSNSTRISRSKSTRKGGSSPTSGGIGGFFGSLFGAKKKKTTSATVRRALSKPGQHRSSSGNVHRRPTGARKESSRRR